MTPATATWLVGDRLGSVRAEADGSGSLTTSYNYDPYGGPEGSSQPIDCGFTGQRQDTTFGLVQLHARWYSPGTGAFLSRDPSAGDPTQPASLAAYVYGLDSPTVQTDPSGRCPPSLCDGGGPSGSGGGGGGAGGGGAGGSSSTPSPEPDPPGPMVHGLCMPPGGGACVWVGWPQVPCLAVQNCRADAKNPGEPPDSIVERVRKACEENEETSEFCQQILAALERRAGDEACSALNRLSAYFAKRHDGDALLFLKAIDPWEPPGDCIIPIMRYDATTVPVTVAHIADAQDARGGPPLPESMLLTYLGRDADNANRRTACTPQRKADIAAKATATGDVDTDPETARRNTRLSAMNIHSTRPRRAVRSRRRAACPTPSIGGRGATSRSFG